MLRSVIYLYVLDEVKDILRSCHVTFRQNPPPPMGHYGRIPPQFGKGGWELGQGGWELGQRS